VPATGADADAGLHAAIADACPNRLLRPIDRTLAPARAARRHHLRDDDDASAHRRRALALQTGLALAIARRDAAGAAAWALELATLERIPSVPSAARADLKAAATEGGAVPAPAPATASAIEPPAFVPARTVAAAPPADDGFPATETMPRTPEPFAPARRAHLEAGALDAPAPAVPALLAGTPQAAVHDAR
jgi:hypothetical protein